MARILLIEDRLGFPPGALGEVDASAECPFAVGAQHRDPDVVVVTDAGPDCGEFGGHLLGETVQALGPVGRDSGDVVGSLEFDGGQVSLLGHGRSSVDPVDTGIFAPDSATWVTWLAISRLRILPAGPSGNSRQNTNRRGCL